MAPQPRLETLFKRRSEPITISGPDPDGEEQHITVLAVKLTPVQVDEATRRGQAARARATARRNQDDSIEYLQALDVVLGLYGDDRALLTQVVAAADLTEQLESIRAQVNATDEWANDNYLQGLFDSFTDDMQMIAASVEAGMPGIDLDDPKTQDAIRIREELERWRVQVAERFEPVLADHLHNYDHLPIEELRARVAREQIRQYGEMAYREEYSRCRIWLGIRIYQVVPGSQTDDCPEGKPDITAPRYFTEREQVDDLEPPVRMQLNAAFEDMEVGALEGNGWPAPAGSSTSSESPSGSETAPSSSPTAATV